MFGSRFTWLAVIAVLTACNEPETPTQAVSNGPGPQLPATSDARERLALRLATALADPLVRQDLADRMANSRAPEGKLQFQALARADGNRLLARLAATGGNTLAEVIADLDAASKLEVYLPVAAHRDSWHGADNFLVATLEKDGDAPVAYNQTGERRVLSANQPPDQPVIALVPQEFDFTGGQPLLAATCWDYCGGGGGSGGGGGGAGSGGVKGLMLTASYFEGDYEGWLKGSPEYEYHVYGEDWEGESMQLSCVSENSSGSYYWDKNGSTWAGAVTLLTDSDRRYYEENHTGGVVRILAWEDDDQACVPRTDTDYLNTFLKALDAAYKSWTSGRVDPLLLRGIKAAPSAFGLAKAVRNLILTGDDFVGAAVETTIAGWAPGGANWVLKGDGARSTGYFKTEYRR
jgi:hypothetical protein